MTLIKTSILSAISNLVRIISGIIVTKFIAVYVGPAGLSLLTQFQNFFSIVISLSTGSINSGVVKYTAEYKDNSKELKSLWSTGIRISLASSSLVALVLIIFRNEFSVFLLKSEEFSFLFLGCALFIFFLVINNFFIAVLNGKKEIKKLTLVNIFSSLVGLVFTSLLTYYYSLHGAMISLVISPFIVFIFTFGLIKNSYWFSLEFLKSKFDLVHFKNLSQYTLMAIISALTLPISHIIIRNHIGDTIGWEEAGYWDAMWKISVTYLGFITMTLSTYYLPRLSEIKNKNEMKKEILNGYIIILPLTLFLSLFIYFTKDLIILLLYTEEFLPMKELFLYQLIGDFLKIASWLIAYIMVAKMQTKLFVITEIIFTLTFISFSFYFLNNFGVIGITIAYALNYLVYFILMMILFIRYLKGKNFES